MQIVRNYADFAGLIVSVLMGYVIAFNIFNDRIMTVMMLT